MIIIDKNNPSRACIEANAWQLARYAAICQEMDIMPVVEPDVNMTGDHTQERDEEVTTWLLSEMMNQLIKQNVYLEGILVKTNMILAGRDCPVQADIPAVAEATLRVSKTHHSRSCAGSGLPFRRPGCTDFHRPPGCHEQDRRFPVGVKLLLPAQHGRPGF